MKLFIQFVTLLFGLTLVVADVSHILHQQQQQHEEPSTPPPPPRPYVFSYSAGREPGSVDRTHTEVSDGSGTIRGSFSYVDPKNQVRTVQYIADENGFHPKLSHALEDTEANRRAAANHLKLYNEIAQAHANSGNTLQDHARAVANAPHPYNSQAVISATNKHLNLYDKIVQEHAHIAAEREAERIAFEATSEANHVDQHYY
ncbi:uncharacterized protein LOC129609713 [Condylostylus longicornis]|uniref:uncharacterized protein LOC129609713 n=1 Tax=Condylostylus longicornis TaxID=2530218 RepID=UPI00244DF32B|nr:uncharacterized protein LOC129609713 [Condylostylus longicornis]